MCKLCDIDGQFKTRHPEGGESPLLTNDAAKSSIKEGGEIEDEITEYFINLAKSYMPAEKQRRRNVGTNKARAIANQFVTDFEDSAINVTSDLIAGNTDTNGWFLGIQEALTNLYLNGAAAAAGYIGNIDGSMLKDVENKLFEQEEYLTRFKDDLDSTDPAEWDVNKIVNRVMMYAPSSVEVVEKGLNRALKRPELPFYPKQKSFCRHNCKCQWKWKTVNKARGDFEVYWELGADPDLENCEICLARTAFCYPLTIIGGEIVTPTDFSEMMLQ